MSKVILTVFAASILALSTIAGANAASVKAKTPTASVSTSNLESVWPRAESHGG